MSIAAWDTFAPFLQNEDLSKMLDIAIYRDMINKATAIQFAPRYSDYQIVDFCRQSLGDVDTWGYEIRFNIIKLREGGDVICVMIGYDTTRVLYTREELNAWNWRDIFRSRIERMIEEHMTRP